MTDMEPRPLTDMECRVLACQVADHAACLREYLHEADDAIGRVKAQMMVVESLAGGNQLRGLCIHHGRENCQICPTAAEVLGMDTDGIEADAADE